MRSRKNQVDASIGARVRARREALGLSQTAVADMLDVTYQQVQKYENGKDHIKIEKMKILAAKLGVTQSFLINGEVAPGLADEGAGFVGADVAAIEQAHDLTRAFLSLRSQAMRDAVLDLARRLAAAEAPERSL